MFIACKFDVYELHLVRRTLTQSLVHYRLLNHDEHQPFFQNRHVTNYVSRGYPGYAYHSPILINLRPV